MSQQKRENIKKQVLEFLLTLKKEQLFRPKANFHAELKQQQELNIHVHCNGGNGDSSRDLNTEFTTFC